MTKTNATSDLVKLVASTCKATNTVVLGKLLHDLGIRTTPSQRAIMEILHQDEKDPASQEEATCSGKRPAASTDDGEETTEQPIRKKTRTSARKTQRKKTH